VAILDLVAAALLEALGPEWRLREIPSLRWRAAVVPGAELHVRLEPPEGEGRVRFTVEEAGRLVSSGTLVAARLGA
jgi:hypothetical protein